jgi:hypothetical protein
LIDAFGGIEKFNSATQTYFKLFYSEEEQFAEAVESMNEAFSALGLTMPNTKEQFRALVEAQDLTTESGRKTYAALLQVSGAFAEVTEAAAEIERKRLEAAAEAVDNAFAALKRAVDKELKAAEKAITDSYEAQRKSIEDQISTSEEARRAAEESLNALQRLFDLLKSNINDLWREAGILPTPTEGRANLDQIINSVLATGNMPEEYKLAEAITNARQGLEQTNYATSFEQKRDRLLLANKLGELQLLVDGQITIEEQQLLAAKTQIELLETQLKQAKSQFELEMEQTRAYYDQVLANAQRQIDALRGIDNQVLSVSQAINNLAAAIREEAAARAAAKAGPAATNTSIDLLIKDAYASIGRTGFGNTPNTIDQEGYNYWKTKLESGAITVEHFKNAFNNEVDKYIAEKPNDPYSKYVRSVRGYASGGYYPGGLALVGEEGPELINFRNPGMVYTAAQTSNLLQGDNSELIKELQALRSEVTMLRAEVRADVSHNAKVARILDRAVQEGDALLVSIQP